MKLKLGHGAVGITVLVAVLAGCSPDGSKPAEPAGGSGKTASEAHSPGLSTAVGNSTSSAPAAGRDPNAWEPTVKITARTFTEQERLAARKEYLAKNYPEDMGSPSEIKLIRWSKTWPEYDANVLPCLREKGFKAESDGEGSFHYPEGIPAAQEKPFRMAMHQCESQYSPDPTIMGQWTEDQLGLVYDYWVQYYIPCMESQGHRVYDEGRPSRETYVSTFFTPERSSWYPPEASADLSFDEMHRLVSICPTTPPAKIFYGK